MAEPQEPKKAMTAFFLYLNDNRELLVKDSGGKAGGAGAVSKFASERWKGMSPADKKPYEDKAAVAKAAYAKALEEFKAAGGQPGKRKAEKKENKASKVAKKAKKEKVKGGPKRPTAGGYGQYLNEHREAVMKKLPAGSKITDVAKAVAAQWKALPADKQEPYKKLFIDKQKAYKIEFEKWSKEQAAKGEAVADGGEEADDGEDGEDDDEDDEDDDE